MRQTVKGMRPKMSRAARLLGALAMLALGVGSAQAAPARQSPRVVQVPSPANPLVALRIYFQVGAVDDLPGKEGLSALTAAMLGEAGTRERTWSEVLEALYPMAAQIRVYGDKEGHVFEGTVHRDNLSAFADLLTAQVLQPRFAQEDFRRHQQDALDHLTKTLRGNDDENLGKQAMATRLFAGHPYGRPSVGTVAGLKAITLDDVRRFYAERFTRDRLVVGVGGGYPAGFPERFAAAFQTLPAKGPRTRALPAPPRRAGLQVLVVDKDARANAVSMGHPLAITRAHPDFYPLTVARSYLGEHRTFNGVLMINMRGKRGLNYGDYAYVENFIQEGWSTFPLPNIPRRQQHFEIWIRPVAPQNTIFAIRQALYETDKLVREGIPAEGFEATRQFLLNHSRLWTQDISRRLGYAIDSELYGRDLVAELQRRLPTMTKADVDRAVRKHLRPKNLTVAVVASDAQSLADALIAGKPSPITYDTKDTPPDVLEEDKVIERFPLGLAKKGVQVVPVDRLFER